MFQNLWSNNGHSVTWSQFFRRRKRRHFLVQTIRRVERKGESVIKIFLQGAVFYVKFQLSMYKLALISADPIRYFKIISAVNLVLPLFSFFKDNILRIMISKTPV